MVGVSELKMVALLSAFKLRRLTISKCADFPEDGYSLADRMAEVQDQDYVE